MGAHTYISSRVSVILFMLSFEKVLEPPPDRECTFGERGRLGGKKVV